MFGSALRCPHCGARNPREQRVCLKCARPLSPDAFASSSATSSSTSTSSATAPPSIAPSVAAPPATIAPVPPSALAPSAGIAAAPMPSTIVAPNPLALSQATSPVVDGAPYAPSGIVSGASALKVLGTTVVASLLVGALWQFVARWLDLVILSACVAGFIVGALVTVVIKSSNCRSVRLALLCGILAGPLVYGTRMILDAWTLRPFLVNAVTQRYTPTGANAATQAQVRQTVEDYFTPWQTFRTYTRLTAKIGTTITDTHSSATSSGTTLKGNVYWGLVAFETLIVCLCVVAVARSAAAEPFCESCGKWHGKSVVMQANPGRNPLIADKIRARDWPGFAAIDGGTWNNKAVTTVTLSRCNTCSDATLKTTSTAKFPKDLKNIQLARENGNGLVSALQSAASAVIPPIPEKTA